MVSSTNQGIPCTPTLSGPRGGGTFGNADVGETILLLVHDPEIAFQLIDIQMDLPAGSTQRIGEMERSVLGEMGNVTGGFFLNTLADMTGLSLLPSPPSVIVDTVGAILSIPLNFLMDKQEEALAVKTTFSAGTRQIHGTFLILPTAEFMKTVLCSQNILR